MYFFLQWFFTACAIACPFSIMHNKNNFCFTLLVTLAFHRNQINRCGPTCMHMFNCPKAEDVVLNRKRKFLIKYASLDNFICSVSQNFANPETAALVHEISSDIWTDTVMWLLWLSSSLVKFSSTYFYCLFMLPFMVNKDVYIGTCLAFSTPVRWSRVFQSRVFSRPV